MKIKALISQIKTTFRFKLCFSKTPRVFGCSVGETVPFKDYGNLKIPKPVGYRHCSTIPKITKVTQSIDDIIFDKSKDYYDANLKGKSMLISTGIQKSKSECITFEKLICPYCYKEIEWNAFYSKVDKYDTLSTDAEVSNDYTCPHCKKTMRVCLNVLILSEQKVSCQK